VRLSRGVIESSRAPLEEAVTGSHRPFPVRRLAANGLEAWAQVLERGYEGYVAKDEASPYVGGRTRAWLKVKQRHWTLAEDRWRRRVTAASVGER
jgi:ATP-dependent DNA ligase